jgi:endonuclease III
VNPELVRAGRIRKALEASRKSLEDRDEDHWPFFGKKPLSKRAANKFLLGCLIDFQWPYQVAWERARRFSDLELGNPPDLWSRILRIPRLRWNARRGSRSLHRFGHRHRKVREVARTLQTHYGGDARNLWKGRTPIEVLNVLEEEIGSGPQVARMTVGALLDEQQIKGASQLKADIHVRRTLGRSFLGQPTDEVNASRLSRLLDHTNPWRFDYLLWKIGHEYCKSTSPLCGGCPLVAVCLYSSRRGGPRNSSRRLGGS